MQLAFPWRYSACWTGSALTAPVLHWFYKTEKVLERDFDEAALEQVRLVLVSVSIARHRMTGQAKYCSLSGGTVQEWRVCTPHTCTYVPRCG